MLTDWLRYISKRYRFNINWSGRELFFFLGGGGLRMWPKGQQHSHRKVLYIRMYTVFLL